jgi:hypothetical protein
LPPWTTIRRATASTFSKRHSPEVSEKRLPKREDTDDRVSNRSDILASDAAGPERLEAAIAGLWAADLDLALSSDSWSIRQIVHHLANGDDIWKGFARQATGNPAGEFTLAWYWQTTHEWAGR